MKVSDETKKTPGKLSSFFTIVLYNTGNLIFLVSIILHLPFLIDTINFDQSYRAVQLFDSMYFFFDIGAALVQLVCGIIILCIFGSKQFPTLLSVIASLINLVVCTFFSVLIYIVDLRNIYFSLQILYLIPIITIFLSSIFLYDDLLDLLRNRFRPTEYDLPEDKKKKAKGKNSEKDTSKKSKKKKSKKGELKSAKRPDEETLIIPEDSFFNQQKIISSAAEKAIPNLSNKSDVSGKGITNDKSNSNGEVDTSDK